MHYATFTIILILGALLGAYTMAFQGATQYWGRKLVGAPDETEIVRQKVTEGMSEAEARGLAAGQSAFHRGAQDAITPKSQNLRNVLFFGCLLFGLIGGWIFFKWYIGIAAFIGTFIATGVLKRLFPKDNSEFFRKRIRKQLTSAVRSIRWRVTHSEWKHAIISSQNWMNTVNKTLPITSLPAVNQRLKEK